MTGDSGRRMIDCVTIVGARPQFIKAAPTSLALKRAGIREVILHTGQHYDACMSEVFFSGLGIPAPRWQFDHGRGTHGAMTAAMLVDIERVLDETRPAVVLVFGDTNSTLAAGLAAAKLGIPLAHVEAGLRSFNRTMPEEINRICTDHVSDLLFCSSEHGRDLLAREGITSNVHVVGDVMRDAFELASGRDRPAWSPSAPALLTLHRPATVDDPEILAPILECFRRWGRRTVFPVHPRTARTMAAHQLGYPQNIHPVEPFGYAEMVQHIHAASVVITDSGGLQKEAYWARRPCLTVRRETEWTETVDTGWNTVVGVDAGRLAPALEGITCPRDWPELYGDGHAADRVAHQLRAFIDRGAKCPPAEEPMTCAS